MTSFAGDWDFVRQLGEGAFAEVHLIVNRNTKEALAVKIMDASRSSDKKQEDAMRKEVLIHRMLKHENVVRFHGSRESSPVFYIFLDYATGGELFDRIEPDVGMPPGQAQTYFHQLLCAVKYLHSVGITHRDIKPENCLLSKDNVLLLADFGLATQFRVNGVERLTNRVCGTLPYVAPEVIQKIPHNAVLADIWSCGVVLVALLTGELPWDEPAKRNFEFNQWRKGKYDRSPWTKLGVHSLALVKSILCIDVTKRASLATITKSLWMRKRWASKRSASQLDCDVDRPPVKRPSRESDPSSDLGTMISSQPDKSAECSEEVGFEPARFSFSQPPDLSKLLLSSQLTQTLTQIDDHLLVRRMTRFKVRSCDEQVLKADLLSALDAAQLSFPKSLWDKNRGLEEIVTISTTEDRREPVVFKMSPYRLGPNFLMLDFRLSRGDGLAFKRLFQHKIRAPLKSYIVHWNDADENVSPMVCD